VFKKISRRMKFIYFIVSLMTVLVSVPALSSVALADPALGVTINGTAVTLPLPAGGLDVFNVLGATDTFVITGLGTNTVTWTVQQQIGTINYTVSGTGNSTLTISSGSIPAAQAYIEASVNTNPATVFKFTKKWGLITNTAFTVPAGQTQPIHLVWNNTTKTFSATASVTDTVTATFPAPTGNQPASGALLDWYLIQAGTPVVPTTGDPATLNAAINALPKALYVVFQSDATHIQTTTNLAGQSTVTLVASAQEAVQVVVVPNYPTGNNQNVTTEVTSFTFVKDLFEKVPLVAWAGEKVLLEGIFAPGVDVTFMLQTPGSIEPAPGQTVKTTQTQTVTITTPHGTENPRAGYAAVLVESQDPREVDVLATYTFGDPPQAYNVPFLIYYMKFEDVTLGNVAGKRAGHNDGLWTPPNPYDASTDLTEETLNVSADALLRARVRGWFINAEASQRVARPINGVTLPAGRWILPDDWSQLAGNMLAQRPHWDIMDAPNDTVVASTPTGSYNSPQGNTATPVIGPFSLGLETMTPTGYDVSTIAPIDPKRTMKTVVPNGALDRWDAPMPPARITFEILAGQGFFKSADKSQIYYTKTGTAITYTEPFYKEMIPANEYIPTITNGYLFNSFATNPPTPYTFWQIVNQPAGPIASFGPILPTLGTDGKPIAGTGVAGTNLAAFPTAVDVYSDNHGEAMVYLNGEWNMTLSSFITNGAYDVPQGTVIGSTTVTAIADYPYFKKFEPIQSNNVTKTWTWGKQILGTDPANYPNGTKDPAWVKMVIQTGTLTNLQGTPPNQTAMSDKKMAWVWVTDPDGFAPVGEQIDWTIEQASGSGINFPDITGVGVSNYNDITKAIATEHGFLAGTGGTTLNVERTIGRSFTRLPTTAEKALFTKFYGSQGLDPANYAVAAVEVTSSLPSLVNLQISVREGFLGTMRRNTTLDFSAADPADDFKLYDANQDGVINMADVIMVERMILGLAPATTEITNAHPGTPPNMGDVIAIEKIILGK